jgi:PIN domain nuclease of toxin-antitoxin system
VSVWEIIVKNRLGKLPLPENPANFVSRQAHAHQIKFLSLDELAVYQLQNLPDLHRDPFDRMLICQALQNRFTILTSDELIKQYPVETLW